MVRELNLLLERVQQAFGRAEEFHDTTPRTSCARRWPRCQLQIQGLRRAGDDSAREVAVTQTVRGRRARHASRRAAARARTPSGERRRGRRAAARRARRCRAPGDRARVAAGAGARRRPRIRARRRGDDRGPPRRAAGSCCATSWRTRSGTRARAGGSTSRFVATRQRSCSRSTTTGPGSRRTSACACPTVSIASPAAAPPAAGWAWRWSEVDRGPARGQPRAGGLADAGRPARGRRLPGARGRLRLS